jgi:hypothetical protein
MQPTRNNRGVAHENGAIESQHGHLKRVVGQALLLRGSTDFDSLDAYRDWIADLIGRRNARRRKLVELERAELKTLPPLRTTDHDEAIVRVTSGSGFILRRVFYTVPSRLIGYRLNLRIYDNRVECFVGQSLVLTLQRRRAPSDGPRIQVVDYRHIIHSLRCKPMALLHLVYRDALFPRPAYRAAWERLIEARSARVACKTMVELLALAHERGCEADLAVALTEQLQDGGVPELAPLRARFAPIATRLPTIAVVLPSIASYDALLPGMAAPASATTGATP